MPPQAGKSNIIDKLKKQGAAKAFEATKGNETKVAGGGDLPAGIEAGVAELVMAKIDETKDGADKGKPFFFLRGVVLQPEMYAGLSASLYEPLYDTPKKSRKTLEEHIDFCLNELRKLGVETKGITIDDWEDVMNLLVEQGTKFRFRTWKGEPTKEFPNPRVNTQFRGVITDYQGPDGEDVGGVDDDSGDAGTGEDSSGGSTGDNDWEAVGALAAEGDKDAIAQITEALRETGMDDDAIEAFPTWPEAAAVLAAGGVDADDSNAGDDEEAAEEWKPEVGHFYHFKPQGARAAVECEVTKVFASTMNLKEAKSGKVHQKVAWTSEPATIGGKPLIEA